MFTIENEVCDVYSSFTEHSKELCEIMVHLQKSCAVHFNDVKINTIK